MRSLSLFVTLCLFWLCLSGDATLHHPWLAFVGLMSVALVVWLARRMGTVDSEGHPIEYLGSAIRYMPWLAGQILLANWDVFKRVWDPKLPIRPRMVEIPRKMRGAIATVTYANSITLTPGTVTVQVNEDTLLVHALTREAAESLESGAMHDRVLAYDRAHDPNEDES